MATELAPTTRLEAVNQMLEDIGERPVNQISGTTRLDVARALRTLDRTNRAFQTRGWWFNEEATDLSPTVPDGEYNVPSNAVKIDVRHNDTGVSVTDLFVRRGTKLYNLTQRKYTGHTTVLPVEMVVLLGFEELPETARHFVFARASVTYQSQTVGSPVLKQWTEEQAGEAWKEVVREEAEWYDYNAQTSPRFSRLMLNP